MCYHVLDKNIYIYVCVHVFNTRCVCQIGVEHQSDHKTQFPAHLAASHASESASTPATCFARFVTCNRAASRSSCSQSMETLHFSRQFVGTSCSQCLATLDLPGSF